MLKFSLQFFDMPVQMRIQGNGISGIRNSALKCLVGVLVEFGRVSMEKDLRHFSNFPRRRKSLFCLMPDPGLPVGSDS
jgi:hypothetical protein